MTNPVDRINDLRQRCRLGEELTLEEIKEALELMRSDRAQKTTSGQPSKPVPLNLNDLFGGDDGKKETSE